MRPRVAQRALAQRRLPRSYDAREAEIYSVASPAGKKSKKALFRIVQSYCWFFENEWNAKHRVMRFAKTNYPMELVVRHRRSDWLRTLVVSTAA